MNTRALLALHRVTVDSLLDAPEDLGWAALASVLPVAADQPPVPAAVVAATAALQRAGCDLLTAYGVGQPGRGGRMVSGCATDGVSTQPLEAVMEEWVGGPQMDAADLLLVLGALADNPALTAMDAALQLERLRSDGSWSHALGLVRAVDEALPVPSGFAQAAWVALSEPARVFPGELDAQLGWVLDHWAPHLSVSARELGQLAQDLLAEESQVRLGGPGPAAPPGLGDEAAGVTVGRPGAAGYVDGSPGFSEDADWMPRQVMLAKQAYVRLGQLSRQ